MPNRPKTPHRSVRVPDGVWQEALRRARTEGTTLTALINRWLADYVHQGDRT